MVTIYGPYHTVCRTSPKFLVDFQNKFWKSDFFSLNRLISFQTFFELPVCFKISRCEISSLIFFSIRFYSRCAI